MPKFVLTPIEHDPFDPTAIEQYLGSPNPVANAASLGKLGSTLVSPEFLGKVAEQVMTLPQRWIGDPAEKVGNALMGQSPELPIDSFGKVAPLDPNFIDASNQLASFVAEGGMAMPKEPNSLGIFGGPRAKIADIDMLDKALRLEGHGVPSQKIWETTGWARGNDNRWRFEISDQPSRLNTSKLDGKYYERQFNKYETEGQDFWVAHRNAIYDMRNLTLKDVLHHPELYKAYPGLEDVKIVVNDNLKSLGVYDPISNQIEITSPEKLAAAGVGNGHDIILHEIQHAIQSRENFAHGGNPADVTLAPVGENFKAQVKYKIQDLKAKENALGMLTATDAANFERLKKIASATWGKDPGKLGYDILSGEVEARNVQERFNFPHKAKLVPSATEDVGRQWQYNRDRPDWAISPDN